MFPSHLVWCIIPGMAGTSLEATQSSLSPTEQRALELLVLGVPGPKIAEQLSKGDPAEAKRWRQRLRRMASSEEAARLAAEEIRGIATLGTVPATKALVKRAKRGRVDAIKLLFEMTGVHNNKVQHEHSGEVSITIKGMQRPEPVATEDSVVDAEVVED